DDLLDLLLFDQRRVERQEFPPRGPRNRIGHCAVPPPATAPPGGPSGDSGSSGSATSVCGAAVGAVRSSRLGARRRRRRDAPLPLGWRARCPLPLPLRL